MNRQIRSYQYFDDWLKDKLKSPKFRREYEKAQIELAPVRAIVNARMHRGMTQAKIAKKMGTTQSAIARLESGSANPSLNFLQRLADALGARLEIRFRFS